MTTTTLTHIPVVVTRSSPVVISPVVDRKRATDSFSHVVMMYCRPELTSRVVEQKHIMATFTRAAVEFSIWVEIRNVVEHKLTDRGSVCAVEEN